MTKLIVGLGNPGGQYLMNRHNFGFLLVDAFHQAHSFPDWNDKFNGQYAKNDLFNTKVVLLKPQTYMNNSGKSVQACVSFFKIEIENILVVYDELELSLGQIKTQQNGGARGHNGLRSIDSSIGKNYYRLRCGIGRPHHKDISSYVLSNFAKSELEEVALVVQKTQEAIEQFIQQE